MKKIALSAAIAATMFVGSANAYTINQYASGLVVPNVIHNGAAGTNVTAVGLTARDAGTVFWVFFDEDSVHIADGAFNVTSNQQANFIWNQATSGLGLADRRGYLVFTLDVPNAAPAPGTTSLQDGLIATGNRIGLMSGNAFQVDTAARDVAFIPTIPLTLNGALGNSTTPTALAAGSDYVLPVNLTIMDGDSIRSARSTGVLGTTGTEIKRLDMRYFIDNVAGGNDTFLSFWTADELPATTAAPLIATVNMFNTAQARQSANFTLTKRNLNFVNVETIAGRPAAFLDGFIQYQLPTTANVAAATNSEIGLQLAAGGECAIPFTVNAAGSAATANCVGGVLSYSVVSSVAFGAVQTMMASHN